jgi:REP element-mobilizing transposase RayT
MQVPSGCCPHNTSEGNKHEQVHKSVACHLALSIPHRPERTYRDTDIQRVSVSTEETLLGNHFWAKGYCVDTVGLSAEMIQKYVKFQEKQEQHQQQLQFNRSSEPSQKGR